MAEFVHLHVHTEYSLLDGANRIEQLTARAAALGQKALAITDHGVMFGAIPFYKACHRHGIKPLIGCEVYMAAGSRHERIPGDNKPYHLTLLAETLTGYKNLMKLVSLGYTEGFYYRPRLDFEVLAAHRRGLIALSGCLSAEIPRKILQGQEQDARRAVERYVDVFGRGHFYLELQDHGLPEQAKVNEALLRLSQEYRLPVVATNDAHYLYPEQSRLQEVLLCIGTNKTLTDPDRMRMPSDQFYVKSAEEMSWRFAHIEGALTNSLVIAERCNVEIPMGKNFLPAFALPVGHASEADYLRTVCLERVARRYGENPPATVLQRLHDELSVIIQMGYEGYFLIVWDFIDYARSRAIPVGPGRGSGAGSLVAYVLGITDIDPLPYGLLFERFLNPERVDMPDFDIDFCYERRGEVIDYVVRKYGADSVAQIITFNTLAARAAIRDVGRAMGLPYGDVDRVAKAIPGGPGVTLEHALEVSADLREQYRGSQQVHDLIDMARSVEGIPRNPSVHAAGVVISAEPLVEHVPLYRAGEEALVTQYDMDQLKDIGLLKMDFLGLRTLTVIHDTGVDVSSIPLDDAPTYAMLARGDTIGLFQLEAGWVAETLRQMKPSRFEDIIAAISLCRPGPMEMIPEYCASKHNPSLVRYPHPDLEEILKETYGIMVYQEQVMQVASRMAGFTLGQADLLRSAVGKKKREELERYESLFVEGCVRKGYSEQLGRDLYALILKFANYGFNKSHAAAYGLVAYQTAWLKRYHPARFMAALMTSVMGSEAKVALYMEDCRRLGVKVLPPDVNTSEGRFTATEETAITFGLAAVKNVGYAAVDAIVQARRDAGAFRSLQEFCERVDVRHLNRKALESLIKAGSFDRVGDPPARRAQMLEAMDRVLEGAHAVQRYRQSGQMSLFDLGVGQAARDQGGEEYRDIEEFSEQALMAMEKEVLGFYVSGHPLKGYEDALAALVTCPVAALADLKDGDRVTAGGLLANVKRVTTRGGDNMAFLTLEDLTGQVEVICFPRVYTAAARHLAEDAVLYVRGRLSLHEDEVKVMADEVGPLARAQPGQPRADADKAAGSILYLRARAKTNSDPVIAALSDVLSRYRGETPVRIKLEPSGKWIEVNAQYRVTLGPELLQQLRVLLGEQAVVVKDALT